MKKQTMMMAVLSTAALMLAVTPCFQTTTFANSAGWLEEDGSWRFYEADGTFVTDSWKKSGDDWYYLNSEGFRAINTEVDEYYVGEEGKRVISAWVKENNDEYGSSFDQPEFFYHYYDQNGKEIEAKWRNIDGSTYYFDQDGVMMTGKQDIAEETYYFGDDGARKSGWFEMDNEDQDSEESTSWYYFNNNGVMVKNETDKKIDTSYYTFFNGAMQTGWVKLTEVDHATASEAEKVSEIAGYQYYDEDGKRAEGWRTIENAEGINNDDETFIFYFKKGIPYYAEEGIQVFTIESKQYGFNTKGEMQTGIKEVFLGNGQTANFYFKEDGIAQTDRQVIYDDEKGLDQIWYFIPTGSKKGQGYDGLRDGVIYINGLRQDANADLKFEPVVYEAKTYLVNTSGKIQKASSSSKSDEKSDLGKGFKDFKDENDRIWTVDTNGVIQ